ncbi:MAG: indole-3-glycerol phosphate synthase TrpC [Phycisphaerales bacterium]|nr:indole-3-glycerol phosphate synthase TrpC [Phycisphaerales bacterium]
MSSVLDEILEHKRQDVAARRAARPLEVLRGLAMYRVARRDFCAAVAPPESTRPRLIAEMKRSSPSAGLLRTDYEPVAIARQYAAAGAAALSVLTDERYFGGAGEHIALVRAAVDLPVLRKDFIVDAYQVHESRAQGADAVLLIAEALEIGVLLTLLELARRLELGVLLEVHDEARLREVSARLPNLPAGVLLGINNRDLRRQCTDLANFERLAPLAPRGAALVAESGIQTRDDVERLHRAGARALLIGETLLRAPEPGVKIAELFA